MTESIFAVAHLADQAVLILLLLLGVFSLCIIIERYIHLNRRYKQAQRFIQRLKLSLMNTQSTDYFEYAEESSMGIEGAAFQRGLTHLKRNGPAGLEALYSAIESLEKSKLEKHLGFLATVGSNGPYIGLFGTVLGIMKAFHEMGQSAGESGGQASVMAGISGALIATAAGLMVAIPAVLAFNYFQKRVKGILLSFELSRDYLVAHSLGISESNNNVYTTIKPSLSPELMP